MMKNTFSHILGFLFTAVFLGSCNYLDIVPDEVATEEDAFANSKAAERYLYSCYAYIPQSNNVDNSMDFTGDETISPFTQAKYVKFAEGNYDASNTIISYWNTLFQGIRQCYLLKENIGGVPGLEPEVAEEYKAQADFLIAYFHMLLIKSYGPTVLVKETPKFDTPREDYLSRSPYDECVEWVAGLFDDAAERLPETREGNEYGLATSVAAKAFKARLLLYAASPLFNGNSDYKDFKNPDGTPLMSQAYDPGKWKIAADAALEAIELAEKNYSLYKMLPGTYSSLPEPQDPLLRTLRFFYMDKDNCKEVIFAETRKSGPFGIQRKSIPWLKGGGWNGIAPTMTMLDRFYTKNGLPVEEDPSYDYARQLDIVSIPETMEGIAEPGKQTLRMNLEREPRYYAWISFQNGYFECMTEKEKDAYAAKWGAKRAKGKKWLTGFLKNENCGLYDNRTNNYSKTGFLNKKSVHPGATAAESGKANNYEYPWPVIRLAELYLDYAEACVEYDKEGYPAKGMPYVDKVRERAGLPAVKDSWKNAKHPLSDYADGKGGPEGQLTKIVRQERMVELYMENQNFWDIRRWKLGDLYFNVPVRGLNINASNLQDFAKITELADQRKFDSPRQYLMPIPTAEITKNLNIVQNPGY